MFVCSSLYLWICDITVTDEFSFECTDFSFHRCSISTMFSKIEARWKGSMTLICLLQLAGLTTWSGCGSRVQGNIYKVSNITNHKFVLSNATLSGTLFVGKCVSLLTWRSLFGSRRLRSCTGLRCSWCCYSSSSGIRIHQKCQHTRFQWHRQLDVCRFGRPRGKNHRLEGRRESLDYPSLPGTRSIHQFIKFPVVRLVHDLSGASLWCIPVQFCFRSILLCTFLFVICLRWARALRLCVHIRRVSHEISLHGRKRLSRRFVWGLSRCHPNGVE